MCAQSDQSSLCAQWAAKDPVLLHADSEDSDQTWANVQADPSLFWAYVILLVCHAVAQMPYEKCKEINTLYLK